MVVLWPFELLEVFLHIILEVVELSTKTNFLWFALVVELFPVTQLLLFVLEAIDLFPV